MTASRTALKSILILLLISLLIEAAFWHRSYGRLTAVRDALEPLTAQLDLDSLQQDEAAVLETRGRIEVARRDLRAVARHLDRDPLLQAARLLPVAGRQADGVLGLIAAADAASVTAIAATDVLLAFARQPDGDSSATSVQQGVSFLRSQADTMAAVRAGRDETRRRRDALPRGLLSPLAGAAGRLDAALGRLDGLLDAYERAAALLPRMLGFDGPRRYLVLAQNETEAFPSGGLISNYGLAAFEDGRLTAIQFEYFVNLFDRWQRLSGGAYVEPPAPLKRYLLREVSWGLGEAGWLPDFPTTARTAQRFVRLGGGPPVDGVIALDLRFVAELLRLFGPLTVADYGVTVAAADLDEQVLHLTRDESTLPGAPGKGFLSSLAGALLDRVFSAPRAEWPALLRLLDRTARERHLQLYFEDAALQAVARAYGLTGELAASGGDFLLLTDTSVNSTKLNLLLEAEAALHVRLTPHGASTRLSYVLRNPFDEWRRGRDPRLVSALMHDGVYGAYVRAFVSPAARLGDVRLDGRPAGAEESGVELGRAVFGRFFPVTPGATRRVDLAYDTPGVVEHAGGGRYVYRLYVQKQAGSGALPLSLRFELPPAARLEALRLDDAAVRGLSLKTDLRVDRTIELWFGFAR